MLIIKDYQPELRKYFESLNREWLEKYFKVEKIDEKYFKDPETEIIKKGGEIFFAELDGKIVGTCSLIQTPDYLELAKMAVTEGVQGRGVGAKLVEEGIARARKLKADKLVLITNSQLTPAIHLYQKFGFQETFRGKHPLYERGDVIMELSLSNFA